MLTKDARNCYYESTDQTSKIVRQLALAGIAVVWIFRADARPGFALSLMLFYALIGFIITLTLDLMQYVVKSCIWGVFHYRKEQGLKRDGLDPSAAQFDVPEWFNAAPLFFFWGKVCVLLASGGFLGVDLWKVLVSIRG